MESGGDVAIIATEITQDRQTEDAYEWPAGHQEQVTTTVTNYKVGTLVVTLLDAKTKNRR